MKLKTTALLALAVSLAACSDDNPVRTGVPSPTPTATPTTAPTAAPTATPTPTPAPVAALADSVGVPVGVKVLDSEVPLPTADEDDGSNPTASAVDDGEVTLGEEDEVILEVSSVGGISQLWMKVGEQSFEVPVEVVSTTNQKNLGRIIQRLRVRLGFGQLPSNFGNNQIDLQFTFRTIFGRVNQFIRRLTPIIPNIINNRPTVSAVSVVPSEGAPGAVLVANATASDPDGDNLTVSWTGPSWVSFSAPNALQTDVTLGNAVAGRMGRVTVSVSDGRLSDTGSAPVALVIPNSAPVAGGVACIRTTATTATLDFGFSDADGASDITSIDLAVSDGDNQTTTFTSSTSQNGNAVVGSFDVTTDSDGVVGFTATATDAAGASDSSSCQINFPFVPAATPTPLPSPTVAPTAEPTATPTAEPTAAPTAEPTTAPTAEPTTAPTTPPNPTTAPTPPPQITAPPTTPPTATPTPTPTGSGSGGSGSGGESSGGTPI